MLPPRVGVRPHRRRVHELGPDGVRIAPPLVDERGERPTEPDALWNVEPALAAAPCRGSAASSASVCRSGHFDQPLWRAPRSASPATVSRMGIPESPSRFDAEGHSRPGRRPTTGWAGSGALTSATRMVNAACGGPAWLRGRRAGPAGCRRGRGDGQSGPGTGNRGPESDAGRPGVAGTRGPAAPH